MNSYDRNEGYEVDKIVDGYYIGGDYLIYKSKCMYKDTGYCNHHNGDWEQVYTYIVNVGQFDREKGATQTNCMWYKTFEEAKENQVDLINRAYLKNNRAIDALKKENEVIIEKISTVKTYLENEQIVSAARYSDIYGELSDIFMNRK